VVRFARELFGEAFDSSSVHIERYEKLLSQESPYLPPLQAIEESDLGKLRDLSDLNVVHDFCRQHVAPGDLMLQAMEAVKKNAPEAPAEFLGFILSHNALFRSIEEFLATPRSLEEVTQYLKRWFARWGGRDLFAAGSEAYLLLGVKARLRGQPLIRPKVHIFWRGLQGFYRCTNPHCGRLYTEYVDVCGVCHARCLPVEVCQNCGQDFYRAYPDDPEVSLDLFVQKRKTKRKKTEVGGAVTSWKSS